MDTKNLTESTEISSEELLLIIDRLISLGNLNSEVFLERINLLAGALNNNEKKQRTEAKIQEFFQFFDAKALQYKTSIENRGLVPINTQKVKRLYMDGCFDLMHSGHFNAIRQAQLLCDVLVVGVISTESMTLRKGPPIMTIDQRKALAMACQWVDQVNVVDEYDPSIETLDRFNCSHVAHGDDLILTDDGEDAYSKFRKINRMKVIKRTEGISTTDIVGRLLLMTRSIDSPHQLRKFSDDGNGLAVSQLENVQENQLSEDKQGPCEIKQRQNDKIKLLNTTRRMRQFSAGNKEPQPNDQVVYIDGSFDILHVGHLETLKSAKEKGDFLIVGLHDDDTINKIKGKNYPVLTLQERVLNVLALKNVDQVIIGAPWQVTENMMNQFNIQLVVQGTLTKLKQDEDVNLAPDQDPYQIPKKLKKFQKIPSVSTLTTEKLVERIIDNRKKYTELYEKKAQKEEVYYKNQNNDIIEI